MAAAGQTVADSRTASWSSAGGFVVEEDDHAVLVPLVEDVGGEQYALARRDALGDVDFYMHDVSSLLSVGGSGGCGHQVTGSSRTP